MTVERETVTEIGLETIEGSFNEAVAYVEAVPDVDTRFQIHETPVGVLAKIVEQIVLIEAPIHVNEVTTRIRSAWGLQRAGARIESAVNNAIRIATDGGKVVLINDFLSIDGFEVKIRNRQNVLSQTLRKPENISYTEISVGITVTISKSFGATHDETVTEVSRMLGFKSTSSVLKQKINECIMILISNKKLQDTNSFLITLA